MGGVRAAAQARAALAEKAREEVLGDRPVDGFDPERGEGRERPLGVALGRVVERGAHGGGQVARYEPTIERARERERHVRAEGRRRDQHAPVGQRLELGDAGVVALMFGAGAEGCTTAQTDGGLFLRLARAYERAPLRVP